MKASLVIIGNEILCGKCQDTNTYYIAKELNKYGFDLNYQQTVLDDFTKIATALKNSFSQSEIVIFTGGLGPTNDDITVEAMSKFFNLPLQFNDDVWKHIKAKFDKRKKIPAESNKKQCFVPKGFKVLTNKTGTAPGLYYNYNGKHLFLTPGVPHEMQYLLQTYILPIIKKEFNANVCYSVDLNTYGIAESDIAEKMEDMQLPEGVKIAWLPHTGRVDIRIYGYNKNLVEIAKKKLYDVFKEYIWAENKGSLAEKLHEILINKNIKLGLAESCTGGLVSKLITDFSGSSKYFYGSIVSYNGLVKHKSLFIDLETLQKYGEVSIETAIKMAKGACKQLNVDAAGAITGIAGPGGGTDDKPVGTVCFAVKYKNILINKKCVFTGSRSIIRKKASDKLIFMLINAFTN